MLLVFWAHVSVPSICGRTWSICLFVGGLGVLFSWVVLLQLAGACLSSMLRTQAWLGELDVTHVFVHERRCLPELGPCVCLFVAWGNFGQHDVHTGLPC